LPLQKNLPRMNFAVGESGERPRRRPAATP
jgi:hypothetical protein